jgi:single-strand DNA-binding protein
MRDIATAQLSGNLTRDVDLRVLPSGADVARLRVASTTRRRTGEDWVDKTNYFTVEVFGAQARSCAEYLLKGSRVFVDAELDWHEWTDQQNNKHEAVTLKARRVLFEDRRLQPDAANGHRDDRAADPSPVPSPPVAAPVPAAAVAVSAADDAGSASADELPY